MKSKYWQNLWENFWNWAGSFSIRTKIFGIVLGSTIILSLTFTFQVQSALLTLLEDESQEQGISIARDVAAHATDLILINDLYALHELLSETQINYHDVRYVFILDPQGNVLVHTFGEGFPIGLAGVNFAAPGDYQNTTVIETEEGLVWDVAVPILGGKIGTVRVGISDLSVRETRSGLISRFIITILIVLTASLLAATGLTWILTRPILGLVSAAQQIAQGDFSPRVAPWAHDEIGDLAEAFNQMAEELARINELREEREQLRRQLLEGVIGAQEEERRRIARELHDSTSQSLTSVMIGLRNLEECCDNPDFIPQIERLRGEISKTLEDVHSLAVQLRPAVLDDLGLEAALGRLVEEWQERSNISTDAMVHIGEDRLPGDVETTLYRIVQEAMTNIAKHAKADSVSVLVERRKDDVVAIIEDNGIGFDREKIPSDSRLGLLGMQERAELLGGKLTVESSAKTGTSIFVTIPINSETELSRG
jgi:signal transduction histidine kinase